jgi:hypothetical protein
MTRAARIAIVLVFGLAAAGCGGSTEESTLGTVSPLDTGAIEPIGSEPTSVESTGTDEIAGFEGWKTINPAFVEIGATQGGLALTLTHRALWFQASQGVLFYTVIDGNFRASATVSTSRTSDSSLAPGGDGTVQLAGLMARAEVPQENYVFVVVGSDANGLSVETKSTKDGQSTFAGPDWPSSDADLQLCRVGATFTLWKRAADSNADWTLARTIERPDLPASLQVGANIYSDSPPDITALFDGLTIEPLDPGESC